ncbi:hypothetical protein E5F05_02360 (plasmid) [Deinococcus metallilatus]|uniref:Uncharacterized protein n=1 Tax=Deinococcus metallilatus TaxID=1211322 RepID=A0ABR6MV10_9DEIO|nr:hypothetical protein [Deinococcus metallilatus]MBB5295755.1 hypothetical protein [Deinococcus metallilatus]QBY06803.1 hypothetical protein E5F05_02360 [Deinococcus metallilatus]GMA14284.1 hypothetical protein GCM10025871_06150 [Deinococcus metallilatus]
MSQPSDVPPHLPQSAELLGAIQAWQRGELPREASVGPLILLGSEQGALVRELIQALLQHVPAGQPAGAGERTTDDWRAELLACRARAWASPDSAGLLVGPTVLILTDGDQGALLSPAGTRRLTGSLSASLLLLCQTIVMADSALDGQELGRLRQQRIESTSTSLSEIKPVS